MTSNPLVSFQFAYRCGSASDPAGKEGLACLTAALIAKGSTRSRSYKQILDAFFEMATGVDVQVDQELTVFSGVVHRDHLTRYESIVLEMLDSPAFLAEDFERIRTEMRNALRVELRGSNDEELAKELLYTTIYSGHPYGHPTLGTVRGLESITLEDVREFFKVLKQSQGIALPPPRKIEGIEAILVEKPDARGVAMSFGHPIEVVRGHKDYHALLVAQCWLGQHRNGGRLFDSIREQRGLNYGDYAYIEYFPRGMHQFEPDPCLARHQQIFQGWLRPVEPAKAMFAFRLAIHEIKTLQLEGMPQDDFERTCNFLNKYVKLLIKTDALRQGYALDSEFYGTAEYTQYISDGLAKLTVDDVNRASRQHLSIDHFCFVAVGPGMQEFGRSLRDGDATPITYETPQPEDILAVDQIVSEMRIKASAIQVVPLEEVFES
jgi:zinc protease